MSICVVSAPCRLRSRVGFATFLPVGVMLTAWCSTAWRRGLTSLGCEVAIGAPTETIGCRGRNQWFPWEKPMGALGETNGFRRRNRRKPHINRFKFRMLSRYKKIEVDSRFSAAEDRGQYSVCSNSAAKQTSFISFYLLLTSSIYKASAACES